MVLDYVFVEDFYGILVKDGVFIVVFELFDFFEFDVLVDMEIGEVWGLSGDFVCKFVFSN